MRTERVRLTFIDELLGTASNNPEIHSEFIASKAPDAKTREEEIAMIGVDEAIKKGKTVFLKDENGNPVISSHWIKGFFKSACSALRVLPKTKSKGLKAYKKEIDLRIFVYPDANDPSGRYIPMHTWDGEISDCQRPLRAQTIQGERVALSDSESLSAGTSIEFDIVMLVDDDWELVKEWLDYGRFNGLGQWRNAGKGAFTWEEV